MTLPEVAALRASVLAEAERAAERTLAAARARAQEIRAQAEAELDAECAAFAAEARVEAARYQQKALGAARLEAHSMSSRRREVVLTQVFARAGSRLQRQIDSYGRVVPLLVREAATELDGVETLMVHGDEAALAVLDEAALARIGEAVGCRLLAGTVLSQGHGVVVESADGRLRYDNTLEARLARLQPTLRAEIYQLLMGEPT